MRTLAMIAAAVILTPAPALAGGAQPRNPYANLFTGQLNGVQPTTPTPPRVPPLSFAPSTQIVACGMTIYPGDAKIDPKILKPVPRDAPKGSIKALPPPMCRK